MRLPRPLPGTVLLLCLIVAACLGCQGPATRDAGLRVGTQPEASESDNAVDAEETPPTTVAPIFDHGRGRAPMGPDASPTFLLGEEEAVQAIRETLAERGVPTGPPPPVTPGLVMPAMTADDLLEVIPPLYFDEVGADASASEALIDDVQLRLHEGLLNESLAPGIASDSLGALIAAELLPSGRPAPDEGAPWRSRVGEADYPGGTWPSVTIQLELDGAETEGKFAFEFVSQDDWVEWKPEVMEESDEKWTLALYDTALSLRTGLCARGGGGVYALFYDPCVLLGAAEPTDPTDAEIQAARTRALELLTAQIDGFLDWYADLTTTSDQAPSRP